METKQFKKEDIEKMVHEVMFFEKPEIFNSVVKAICNGDSVVVDGLCYKGNGQYVNRNLKKRYKYKMLVPIVDKYDNLYSTDLYEGNKENAIKGEYAIYRITRQLAIGIVCIVETDYKLKRFDFGYTQDNWGQYKIIV
jgi:hypothetical protein